MRRQRAGEKLLSIAFAAAWFQLPEFFPIPHPNSHLSIGQMKLDNCLLTRTNRSVHSVKPSFRPLLCLKPLSDSLYLLQLMISMPAQFVTLPSNSAVFGNVITGAMNRTTQFAAPTATNPAQ
jgi:hypothetical protein